MPEIMKKLQALEEFVEEWTADVVFRNEKRASDINGDRRTMEYQGLDPDVQGLSLGSTIHYTKAWTELA